MVDLMQISSLGAFTHALLSHAYFCVSWSSLYSNIDHYLTIEENWATVIQSATDQLHLLLNLL